MTTRIIMILLAVVAAGTARAQANLDSLVHRMETVDSRKIPVDKTVSVVSHEEKDRDGNVFESQKTFLITNGSEVINEILAAFEKDKADASWVQEVNGFVKLESGKEGVDRMRMYSFNVGEKGRVNYQFLGANDQVEMVRLIRTYTADHEKRLEESRWRRSVQRAPSRGPLLSDVVPKVFKMPNFDWRDFEPGDAMVVDIQQNEEDKSINFTTDTDMVMSVKRGDDGSITWFVKEK
jgi:hypothetical protein